MNLLKEYVISDAALKCELWGSFSPSSGPCSIRYCVVSALPSSALVTAIHPVKWV